jgi:Arc/MetJ-type ribon-helix-helix transcriptional regulator
MKTLMVQCPDPLADELERFVRDGGFPDTGQMVVEALRRFLESHRPEIVRKQALDDVTWGLHGKD